jgi:hypothetical protein
MKLMSVSVYFTVALLTSLRDCKSILSHLVLLQSFTSPLSTMQSIISIYVFPVSGYYHRLHFISV